MDVRQPRRANILGRLERRALNGLDRMHSIRQARSQVAPHMIDLVITRRNSS